MAFRMTTYMYLHQYQYQLFYLSFHGGGLFRLASEIRVGEAPVCSGQF
jgi:hypothetical protein